MDPAKKEKWSMAWPLLLFGLLVVLIITAWVVGFEHYFSFHQIRENQARFLELVDRHPYLSPLAFVGLYILASTLALPVETLLSVASGYFFSQPFSTLYTLIGATVGGFILFIIARAALHTLLRRYPLLTLRKMEDGFRKNAVSYLLFLRFIPLFPFWIVNLSAALFDVKATTFLWTTAVGLIPAAFAHAEAGRGLSRIIASGDAITLRDVLNPEMRIGLVALAILSLCPILIKWILAKRKPPDQT